MFKSRPSEKVKVELGAGRTVLGYASAWETRDSYGDRMIKGAFRKTIKERGDKNQIKVLYLHEHPIGIPTKMNEDVTGLYTESAISKTAMGEDVMTMIADTVLDSMSVGFDIIKGEWDNGDEFTGSMWDYYFREDDWGDLMIKEARLWEYSIVPFPANEDAAIVGVKAALAAQNIDPKLRELKAALDEIKALKALNPGVVELTSPPNFQGFMQVPTGDLTNSITTVRVIPGALEERQEDLDVLLKRTMDEFSSRIGEERAQRAYEALKALQEPAEPAAATPPESREPQHSAEAEAKLQAAMARFEDFATKSFAPAES